MKDIFDLQSPYIPGQIAIARKMFPESESFKDRAPQGAVVQVPRDDRPAELRASEREGQEVAFEGDV